MNELETNNLLIYKNKDGNIIVDAIFKDETLWLSQKGMSKVFDVGIPAISKQLKKIFDEGELKEEEVISKMENTTNHGAMIVVGYRVNSKKQLSLEYGQRIH